MSKIGIVILNYITWQETRNCIRSIKKSDCIEDIHIYVVDNASYNLQELKKICEEEQVELLLSKANVGYAAGNNLGIAKALSDGCQYVLISNNDVIFEADSISILYRYLERHSEYGIASPGILDKNGKLQRCHYKKRTDYLDIWTTQTIFRHGLKKFTDKLYGDLDYYKEAQDIYAASGCCFMMSSNCARKVTPLDENTFLYQEENILGIHMELQGMKTKYLPQSKVIHNHDQTTRLVKPFALICWACSEIYYLENYLHVSKFKINMLYQYRTLIFLLHGLKNSEYRVQWPKYKEMTGKYLEKK